MRIVHAPVSRHNPYHKLLIGGQKDLGHEVVELTFSDLKRFFPLIRNHVGSCDVLHLHWLAGFYQTRVGPGRLISAVRAMLFTIEIWWLRIRGVRVVWTVHELTTHDASYPQLERLLGRGVARSADVLIVHCRAMRELVVGEWKVNPDKVWVIPIGTFQDYYPNKIDNQQARQELGIDVDNLVLLFFGWIRTYKGVRDLLEAFRAIESDKISLVIAGDIGESSLVGDLEQAHAQDPRILLHLGYVPDERVQYYMRAADVLVAPYRRVGTSATLISAAAFDKPVIAPAIGCLPEQAENGRVILYDPLTPGGLGQAIRSFMQAESIDEQGAAEQYPEWSEVARLLIEVYIGGHIKGL